MNVRLLEIKPEICELYYVTGSVGLHGPYDLSVHKDNANHPAPKSPWYMKYPNLDEVSVEKGRQLIKLYSLIGEAFFEIRENLGLGYEPHRLGPIPYGAGLLGEEFGSHYPSAGNNVERFGKIVHPDGSTTFTGPERDVEPGEEMETVDDHTSSAHNHRKFVAHARKRGFMIVHAFTVVDRQQGGVKNLAAEGVTLHAILTADEILGHGLEHGHVTEEKFKEIQDYRTTSPS